MSLRIAFPKLPSLPAKFSADSLNSFAVQIDDITRVALQQLDQLKKQNESYSSVVLTVKEVGATLAPINNLLSDIDQLSNNLSRLQDSIEVRRVTVLLNNLTEEGEGALSGLNELCPHIENVLSLYLIASGASNSIKAYRSALITKEKSEYLMDWIDELPASPFYDRWVGVNTFLELVFDPKFNLYDCAQKYSAEQLINTGWTFEELLKLFEDQPALLDSLVQSGLQVPVYRVRSLLKIRFIFEMAKTIPKAYLPALQRVIEASCGELIFEDALPFLRWCKKEFDQASDQNLLLDGMERVIALYWKSEVFEKAWPSIQAKGDYPSLIMAVNGIQRLNDAKEVAAVIEKWVCVKQPSAVENLKTLASKHPSNTSLLARWISSYYKYINENKGALNWEECLQLMVVEPPEQSLSDSILLLETSSLTSKAQGKVLELAEFFPFRIKEIVALYIEIEELRRSGNEMLLLHERLKELMQSDPKRTLKILYHTNNLLELERSFSAQPGKQLTSPSTQVQNPMTLWEQIKQFEEEDVIELYEAEPAVLKFFKERAVKNEIALNPIRIIFERNKEALLGIVERASTYDNVLLNNIFLGASAAVAPMDVTPEKDLLIKLYQASAMGYLADILNFFKNFKSALEYLIEAPNDDEKARRQLHAECLRDIYRVSEIAQFDLLVSLLKTDTPKSAALKEVIVKREHGPLQALINLDENTHCSLISSIALDGLTHANRAKLWEATYNRPYTFDDAPFSASVKSFELNCSAEDCTPLYVVKAIADRLILPDGTIDRSSIDAISTSDSIRGLPFISPVKKALAAALQAIRVDPEFSQRLAALHTTPARGSEVGMLVRHVMQKPEDEELTLQDVRHAVLSGLLWPTRQGGIGSCFATGFVIRDEFYHEGIKQKFEDLCMMTHEGVIRVNASCNGKTHITLPVFGSDLIRNKSFYNDHLLSRAREFTLSSMGVGEHRSSFNESLLFDEYFKNLISPFNIDLHEDFSKTLNQQAAFLIERVYLAASEDPISNELGSWCLRHRKTGRVINSAAGYVAVIHEILDQTREQLVGAKPILEAILGQVFDGLKQCANSSEFMSEMMGVSQVSPLLMLNPERYAHLEGGPWITYAEGGASIGITSRLFNITLKEKQTFLRSLENRALGLMILHEIQGLPPAIKEICQQHSEYRELFKFELEEDGHECALKPADLLKELAIYTPAEILQKFIDEAIAYYERPCEEGKLQTWIETLRLSIQDSSFQYIMSSPEIASAKSLKGLWNAIINRCYSMGLSEEFRKYVETTFMRVAAWEQGGLPSFKLGDSNYRHLPEFGLVVGVNKYNLIPAFLSDDSRYFRLIEDMKSVSFFDRQPYRHDFNRVYSGH